jgi:hypothetical protein
MVSRLVILLFIITLSSASYAQTCTLSASGNVNWNNATCLACDEGVSVTSCTATTIIVPSDLILRFDTNTDTWSGTTLIVEGELRIIANIVIQANIVVTSAGEIQVNDGYKLDIGSASDDPCPYSVSVESGGIINFAGTNASDRLRICNKTIAIPAGGSCNPFPTGPIPYCEPAGGFTGPFVFTESGLPIELLYFNLSIPKNENRTLIEWATESEEDFKHFEIQRAGKDLRFTTILEILGAGYNTNSIQEYSTYDENPLIGIGYYRLKAVDIDGSYEYFKIKSVNHGGGRRLLVSPNPTTGNSFSYSINWDPGLYDRISLIDAIGNEVYSEPVTALQNELHMNKTLRPGAYLLRYTGSSFQEVTRVFIKD